MSNADWGAGLATGLAAGKAAARRNSGPEVIVQTNWDSEDNIRNLYAVRAGYRALSVELMKALAEYNPKHPLIHPLVDPTTPWFGSAEAKELFSNVSKSVYNEAPYADQEFREKWSPALARSADQEMEERRKEEEKKNRKGFFSSIFGAKKDENKAG